jgi:hypothetical protein
MQISRVTRSRFNAAWISRQIAKQKPFRRQSGAHA